MPEEITNQLDAFVQDSGLSIYSKAGNDEWSAHPRKIWASVMEFMKASDKLVGIEGNSYRITELE